MIVKGQDGTPSDENAYGGADTLGDTVQAEPPPSYHTASSSHTSLSDVDATTRSLASDMSIREPPAQIPFNDLITGSHPYRRGPPVRTPTSEPREEYWPESPQDAPQSPVPSNELPHRFVRQHEPSQQPEVISGTVRPQLPHASRSAPDPRTRAKLEHVQELEERDQFGNTIHDESPFAAARRAQRVDNGVKQDVDTRAYVNGRMPSFRPGEIVPVNTMRSATSAPLFFPPQQAPSFPPTSHPPIRPAHFPPELHPTIPQQQPTRAPSHRKPPSPQSSQNALSRFNRQSVPVPAPQPQPQAPPLSRALSERQPPPAPRPQPAGPYPPISPAPMVEKNAFPHRQQQMVPQVQQARAPPQGLPGPVPSPRPPHVSAPQLRRNTYDARHGIPFNLTPNGYHPQAPPGAPQQHFPPHPSGQPQSQLRGHSPSPASATTPQSDSQLRDPPFSRPGRSILREPQRHSVLTTPSPLAPAPIPVRLPSQNMPPRSPHALGIVHMPPSPSGSPRPDPNRAPRPTPKPVMPQLLEPLSSQNSYGRSGSTQLQRSATVSPLPSEKGGLLSKTRSILRKRSSTPGIKTHGDGTITLASQPHPSKRHDNVPALPSLREESGGFISGKLGKRLSKRK